MPGRSMTTPTKTRPGGSSPRRRENRKNNEMTARAAESNGVAGGSHPPPARPGAAEASGRRLRRTAPRRRPRARPDRRGQAGRAPGESPGRSRSRGPPRPTWRSWRPRSRRATTSSLSRSGPASVTRGESVSCCSGQGAARPRRVHGLGRDVAAHSAVESARAYMRVARNGAIVEEGSKRQFASGLTLADVLKRLAKPRAKGTAGECGRADTSTNSSRPDRAGRRGPMPWTVRPRRPPRTPPTRRVPRIAPTRPRRPRPAGRPPMRMRIAVETKMAQMVGVPSGPTAGPGATRRPSPLGTMTRPRPRIPMRRRSPRSNSMMSSGWRAARSGRSSRTRRPSTARHCCGAAPGPRSSG